MNNIRIKLVFTVQVITAGMWDRGVAQRRGCKMTLILPTCFCFLSLVPFTVALGFFPVRHREVCKYGSARSDQLGRPW